MLICMIENLVKFPFVGGGGGAAINMANFLFTIIIQCNKHRITGEIKKDVVFIIRAAYLIQANVLKYF